ncbi:hypothetical protein I872_08220 [Streptococcus cristatus AS 1.3089]|uniref:DUF2974 domain-containing protein n=3 Tax=Streptococcus cristatus TaxID=45634 RepID=A0A512ABP4_STRCR|nr:hypothetical protein I872_08220 [Streptococcus cristatus AS 1.3089]GEN97094.1 hypothetical protein SOL01_09680 [Streptococcus cristatus]
MENDMGIIFDYLDQVAYDSIYDTPFNELDMLMLTEITYLPFDQIVSDQISPDCTCRLFEAAEKMPQDLSMLVTKNRLKLLEKVASSTRFKNIKLMGYVNDIDPDVQKQFAAMIFKIKPDSYVLTFRGTDDSIIGWKEDFHMTYMDQVPAQKTAVNYLRKAMDVLPGQFILTGHSKGGNLASYAASQIEPEYQERIQIIYSYDAPGLNHSVITSQGYQTISDKIKRYIPQGSIVGMMLETPKQAQIVKSTAIGGLAQHDTFTWQISDQTFVLLDNLNPDSLQVDKTLKNWVDSVSDEELKDFFDLFFGLILDAGISSINDLTKLENFNKILAVFENANALTDHEREMLTRLAKLLVDMRYQSWKDDINLLKPSKLVQEVKENLSEFTKNLPFTSNDPAQTDEPNEQ